MTLGPTPTRFTPEDLLQLEEDGLYELVDGKLVEKEMSFLANKTAGLMIQRLRDFAEETSAGEFVPEQTFQCFPHDPDLVRRPDIAFIAAARVTAIPDEGHVRIAPDIAIEVVSPGDRIYELDEKLADYRSAGIRLVWEVNPKFRYIRVHQLGRPIQQLGDTDMLTGEPVLPRLSIPVKELLPPIEAAKA